VSMAESATSLVALLPLSQPLYWSGLRHRKRLDGMSVVLTGWSALTFARMS